MPAIRSSKNSKGFKSLSKNFIDTIISSTYYHHRVMVSIIVAQLILISVFKFWPAGEKQDPVFQSFEKEAFIVEEMVITKQANAPASPPKPQVPIPVPNDQVIEEEIDFPDIDDFFNQDPLAEGISTGQTGDESRISGNPDRPPRVIRIVEPVLTEGAKRANIKAMIVVNFLVNGNGTVREAYIAEIRLFDKEGRNYQVVNEIGYGLMQATIEAALQWRFRPAEEEGNQVSAYAQDIFSFGF